MCACVGLGKYTYIPNEYVHFCHLHASLSPGKGKVCFKEVLTWVMALQKKGSRESIKLIFILKEVVEICVVPN